MTNDKYIIYIIYVIIVNYLLTIIFSNKKLFLFLFLISSLCLSLLETLYFVIFIVLSKDVLNLTLILYGYLTETV